MKGRELVQRAGSNFTARIDVYGLVWAGVFEDGARSLRDRQDGDILRKQGIIRFHDATPSFFIKQTSFGL
jgi:hypothetical protein